MSGKVNDFAASPGQLTRQELGQVNQIRDSYGGFGGEMTLDQFVRQQRGIPQMQMQWLNPDMFTEQERQGYENMKRTGQMPVSPPPPSGAGQNPYERMRTGGQAPILGTGNQEFVDPRQSWPEMIRPGAAATPTNDPGLEAMANRGATPATARPGLFGGKGGGLAPQPGSGSTEYDAIERRVRDKADEMGIATPQAAIEGKGGGVVPQPRPPGTVLQNQQGVIQRRLQSKGLLQMLGRMR